MNNGNNQNNPDLENPEEVKLSGTPIDWEQIQEIIERVNGFLNSPDGQKVLETAIKYQGRNENIPRIEGIAEIDFKAIFYEGKGRGVNF